MNPELASDLAQGPVSVTLPLPVQVSLKARAALASLDWNTPWYKPLLAWGPKALAHWHSGQSLAQSLNQAIEEVYCHTGERPHVSFVSQELLPKAMAYETFIQTFSQVPTREHVHDFFNAMSWCRWPKTKALISHLQGQAIERQNAHAQQLLAQDIGPTALGGHEHPTQPVARGLLRDRLTLIDESGVFLSCTDAMWSALCEHRWMDLFLTERDAWAQCQVHIVGHALLEKFINPYKSITAQVLRVSPPPNESWGPKMGGHERWDERLRDTLANALPLETQSAEVLRFQVLPLMGIPGWAQDQDRPGYYEDPGVFRPASNRLRSREDRKL